MHNKPFDPAYPHYEPNHDGSVYRYFPGLSIRQQAILNAPIEHETVRQVYKGKMKREPSLFFKEDREHFMNLWAKLAIEWADTVLKMEQETREK